MAGEVDRAVSGDRPVLIEVTTPWCTACRSMRGDLEAAAAAFREHVDFLVVDASRDREEADALMVKGTPTLIGVRDGHEVFRVTGRRSASELKVLFGALGSAEVALDPGIGRIDRHVRMATGLVLMALGLSVGPAWPLAVVGAGLCCAGVVTRGRPADE